eukprot:1505234-Pleurochrysis_carterae.AAC.1
MHARAPNHARPRTPTHQDARSDLPPLHPPLVHARDRMAPPPINLPFPNPKYSLTQNPFPVSEQVAKFLMWVERNQRSMDLLNTMLQADAA